MKRILCLLLSILMCASIFVACDDERNPADETETPSVTDEVGVVTDEPEISDEADESTTPDASATQSATAKPSATTKPSSTSKPTATKKPTSTTTSTPTPTVYSTPDKNKVSVIPVELYGAVGDGVTNNYSAIAKAIRGLKQYPKGSTLLFQSNATYYCGNQNSAITLSSVNGYTIKGSNTTILIDAPAQFMTVQSTTNLTIQGLNFNYKNKPYAFTTSVDSVNLSTNSAEVTLDRSLNISKTFRAPSVEFFAVVNRDDGRHHMSISNIRILDASKNKYKITFNDTFKDIDSRLNAIKTYGMIVPVPEIGHSVEQAFTILSNKNLTFKDCNVWSACKFMFFIRENSGTLTFDNLNVTPDPKENGGNIRIVGWRDGFHCKENRASIIWKNCTLEWVYDDIFNISASMLSVESVNGKNVSLIWPENAANGGSYPFMRKGDVISFYDIATGKDLGEAKITSVSGNNIVLEKEIAGIANGTYAVVDSLVAPNSQLINCNIKGTIRFRGPLTATNCNIHCTRMWLAFESANELSGTDGIYLEGPVPENITFKNCKFTFDSSSGQYIEVFSVGGTTAADSYHVSNIVFDGCQGVSKNNFILSYGEASRNDVYTIK